MREEVGEIKWAKGRARVLGIIPIFGGGWREREEEVEERERRKNLRREEVREVWRGQKREEYGLEGFLGDGLHDSGLFWDFGMGTKRDVGGI